VHKARLLVSYLARRCPLDTRAPHNVHKPAIMKADDGVGAALHAHALPLDGSLLVLDSEAESFFMAETRIQHSEELKKHIIEVQEEAYKVSHSRSAN
jgi:hypothetical protein